jgi:cell division protein FtsL
MGSKCGSRVSEGLSSTIIGSKLVSNFFIALNEAIVETAVETINVTHHASAAVEDTEEITKEFLRPAPYLVNGAVIF